MIIKNDVFNCELLKQIYNEVSYNSSTINWFHRSSVTIADTGSISHDLTNSFFFYEEMRLYLQKELNMDFCIQRVYLNIMSYGSEGSYHYDSQDKNAYTILLFLMGPTESKSADEYGGYFYYKENNEIKCIEPINNRLVVFKSDIIHKATCFNRMVKKPRFSIAWKVYTK